MRKNILIFLLLIIPILLMACSEKQAKVNEQKLTAPKYNLSMVDSDVDPYCGMKLTEKSIQDTVHFKGKVYGFCSSVCVSNFRNNPDTYIKNRNHQSQIHGNYN